MKSLKATWQAEVHELVTLKEQIRKAHLIEKERWEQLALDGILSMRRR